MQDGIALKGMATLGKTSNGIGSLGIGRIFGGVPYWSLLTQRNKGVDGTTELVDTLSEAFVSRANYVGSNCGYFSRNGAHLNCGDICATEEIDLTIEVTVKDDSISAYLVAKGVGTLLNYGIGKTSSDIFFTGYRDGLQYVMLTYTGGVGALSDGAFHQLQMRVSKLAESSYLWELVVNGSVISSANKTDGCEVSDSILSIGGAIGSSYSFLEITRAWSADCFSYSFSKGGDSLIIEDDTGNGNIATVVNTTASVFWSKTQDYINFNLENGFSLYEHATSDPMYVSFLTTGIPNPSPTIPAGYTLTKHAEGCLTSGGIHNGAEAKMQGTDSNVLYSRFFSDDETTLEERDWDFAQAFLSGEQDWLRWGLDKYGSCKLEEQNLYNESFEPDATEETRLETYHKQGDCGGGFIT